MNTEIGERIRQVLSQHEKLSTQRELADRAEMTPDALSRALSGSRGFAVTELLRLAGVLGTSFHWLATGEDDPYAIRIAARHEFDHSTKTHDAVEWSPARQKVEDIALAYAQVGAADWQAADSQDPPRALPGLSAGEARAALADAAGGSFVRSFADAVETTFGIDVIRLDNLSGSYSLALAGRTIIVLSDTSNWFYQNWSLAHELGHVAQGTMEPLDDPDREVASRERRANAFAGDLLLPRELVRTIDWKKANPNEVAEFLWRSGVSTRTLATRLCALRYRISSSLDLLLKETTQSVLRKHSALLPEGAPLEIARRLRDASVRRFPAPLLAAHREAIARGDLHVHTLAWMLGASAEALERELAPLQVMPPASIDDLAGILGLDI